MTTITGLLINEEPGPAFPAAGCGEASPGGLRPFVSGERPSAGLGVPRGCHALASPARDPSRAPRAAEASPARKRPQPGRTMGIVVRPVGCYTKPRPARARRPPPQSLPEGAEARGGGLAGPSRRRIPRRRGAAAAFLPPRCEAAVPRGPPLFSGPAAASPAAPVLPPSLPLRGGSSATPATLYGRPPDAPKRPRLPRAPASGSPWTPREGPPPRSPSWLGGLASLPREGPALPPALSSRFRRETPQRRTEEAPPRRRRRTRSVGGNALGGSLDPFAGEGKGPSRPARSVPWRLGERARPRTPPAGSDGPPFRVVVHALR
ncbi:basic proline-rich protein-like [Ahaetulla prasina]|uniref:basic proline-rich protein-like n=1 Tax=Ahaetulla prasina TaxID=499056 RepID=UPI002648145E|nr:basic proline-rich protein-like [Ahaetulla prasina]